MSGYTKWSSNKRMRGAKDARQSKISSTIINALWEDDDVQNAFHNMALTNELVETM